MSTLVTLRYGSILHHRAVIHTVPTQAGQDDDAYGDAEVAACSHRLVAIYRPLSITVVCRKNIPPYIKNLEDVERLSEGKLKIPQNPEEHA